MSAGTSLPIANETLLAATTADSARRLRDVLDRAGYSMKNIIEHLGAMEVPSKKQRNLPKLLYLTRAGGALDVLLRLFLFHVPVPLNDARRAVAPTDLAEWYAAGLLGPLDDSVIGHVQFVPYMDLLLASDPPDMLDTGSAIETVPAMTGSSLSLMCFTVRRQAGRTLDLGTGQGIQSLLASPHSDVVVATDITRRSLSFTDFNARFNGVSNVETRLGGSFEPVAGEKFDLIVSNPPFMVSPTVRYVYRDSGKLGDEFVRSLIRSAPAFLNEGGYCHMTADWIHPKSGGWKERVESWFEGSSCDVLVLKAETRDPATYANQWLYETEVDLSEAWESLYNEWVSYYEQAAIESISTGIITFRKNNRGSHSIRFEDSPGQDPAHFGPSLELEFELRDALRGLASDEALLNARLHVAPDLRLEQRCKYSERTWDIVAAKMQLTSGIRYSANMDSRGIRIITGCDGNTPVRDVLARLATHLGVDVGRVIPPSLPLIRDMIQMGFLLPEGVEKGAQK